ncbi:hypothetical protein P7K49_018621 [Saguinus oedipus]|uniref:Uncharacterized protein n=1 Tax=Saguinus oedipus TaxID=9490 RepID=A0ABQ9V608_SAGOE|nr:hypothetical protein P7K49_018621 [Saguinus oedipus]
MAEKVVVVTVAVAAVVAVVAMLAVATVVAMVAVAAVVAMAAVVAVVAVMAVVAVAAVVAMVSVAAVVAVVAVAAKAVQGVPVAVEAERDTVADEGHLPPASLADKSSQTGRPQEEGEEGESVLRGFQQHGGAGWCFPPCPPLCPRVPGASADSSRGHRTSAASTQRPRSPAGPTRRADAVYGAQSGAQGFVGTSLSLCPHLPPGDQGQVRPSPGDARHPIESPALGHTQAQPEGTPRPTQEQTPKHRLRISWEELPAVKPRESTEEGPPLLPSSQEQGMGMGQTPGATLQGPLSRAQGRGESGDPCGCSWGQAR